MALDILLVFLVLAWIGSCLWVADEEDCDG